MPALNLVVLRVSNLEASRRWYEGLGFDFVQERHGNGPAHYACEREGMVFELYPASDRHPVSNTVRLGFTVPDIAAAVARYGSDSVVTPPQQSPGCSTALLVDPDGIRVALEQRSS